MGANRGPIPDGCYLDRAGKLRDPQLDYDGRLDATDSTPLRAVIEEVVLLAAGVVWYWADRERNLADWDFPSWKQRFTLDAWRYDNNEFPINFMGHTVNGTAFYAFPRANEHGPYVSLLYSFTTSFLWEFLLEFREKVSINDVILTPLAGMSLGEFAAKLWQYVNGLPEGASTGHQVAAGMLGFPTWLHRWMDDAPAAQGTLDELGLSDAMAHRFELGYQLRVHSYGRELATHGFRLAGRLSTIAGEGHPGSYGLWFHQADVASLELEAGTGGGAREFELKTDTVVVGYYHQALERSGQGWSMLVGMPLSYDYRFVDLPGFNDRLARLHLPGLGVDGSVTLGPATLTSRLRLWADFAGIHAAAYPEWVRAEVGPDDRPKSILRKHGYYYGWGVSSEAGLGIRIGPLDARLELSVGGWASHDGLDRTQEELTLDPSSADQRLELEASIGWSPPETPLRLGIGSLTSKQRSRVEQFQLDRERQVWSLSLAAVL